MSYYAILLAPLALLLPLPGPLDTVPAPVADSVATLDAVPAESYVRPPTADPAAAQFPEAAPFRAIAEAFREQQANQVRIEQQMTIRISPRPQPVRPNMLMDLPSREIGPRLIERKMGKCLKVSGIAGVQPDGASRLLLFMRDRRLISADLERTCRSRDFYSGFYLSRSTDGQLCVDRDTLLSRSGANCRLTRIRQLVESDD